MKKLLALFCMALIVFPTAPVGVFAEEESLNTEEREAGTERIAEQDRDKEAGMEMHANVLKRKKYEEYKVGDIHEVYGEEVVEVIDEIPYGERGLPFYQVDADDTGTLDEDKKERARLAGWVATQEGEYYDSYKLDVRFGRYFFEEDIQRLQEEYEIELDGFGHAWPRSGGAWFGDKDKDFKKGFKEFRDRRIKTIPWRIEVWKETLGDQDIEALMGSENMNSLDNSALMMIRAKTKELEYFEQENPDFFAREMIGIIIPKEHIHQFLEEEDIFIQSVWRIKKKLSSQKLSDSSLTSTNSLLLWDMVSSLEFSPKEEGNISLQEAGSNITGSPFLTWAPSYTRVYYDLTDRKNGKLGSRFVWTDHTGLSEKHYGYEHELRINDVDVFDCKVRKYVDYDYDFSQDLDPQMDLHECDIRSTEVDASNENFPNYYVDTRFGDLADSRLVFTVGFTRLSEQVEDYQWYDVYFNVEESDLIYDDTVQLEYGNELTHYADNSPIEADSFMWAMVKKMKGLSDELSFCYAYGPNGPKPNWYWNGDLMDDEQACMFKSDQLITLRKNIKMGEKGEFLVTGLVGLMKNDIYDADGDKERLKSIYLDRVKDWWNILEELGEWPDTLDAMAEYDAGEDMYHNQITPKIREAYYKTEYYQKDGILAGLLNTIGTPYSSNGGGVYLHEWDGAWLQNFKQSSENFEKYGNGESAIIYNPSLDKAFLVPGNIWLEYAKKGPKVVGVPISEEVYGSQAFSKGNIQNGEFVTAFFPRDHWARFYIETLEDKKVLHSIDENFPANIFIEKSQILNWAILAKGDILSANIDPQFADVKKGDDHYYEIAYAAEKGWINGEDCQEEQWSGQRCFYPNKWVNRAEASKIILNVFGVDASSYVQKKKFSDVKTSDWFYDFVMWMANNTTQSGEHLVSGKKGGIFDPNGHITHAETAKIIVNLMLKNGIAKKTTTVPKPIAFTNTKEEYSLLALDPNGETSEQEVMHSMGNLYEQQWDPSNEKAPDPFYLTNKNVVIISQDGAKRVVNFEGDAEVNKAVAVAEEPKKTLEVETFPEITENLNIPLKIKLPKGVPVIISAGKTLKTEGFLEDVFVEGGGTLEITGDVSVGKINAPTSIVILNGVSQKISAEIVAKKVIFRNPSATRKSQKYIGENCIIRADVEIDTDVRVRNPVGKSGKCEIHGNLVNSGKILLEVDQLAGVKNESQDSFRLLNFFIPQAYASDTGGSSQNFLEIFVYGSVNNEGEMEDITLGFEGDVQNTGEIENVQPVLIFEDEKEREVKISAYVSMEDETVEQVSGRQYFLPKDALKNGVQLQVREKISAENEEIEEFSSWSKPVSVQKDLLEHAPKKVAEKSVSVPEKLESSAKNLENSQKSMKKSGGGTSVKARKAYRQKMLEKREKTMKKIQKFSEKIGKTQPLQQKNTQKVQNAENSAKKVQKTEKNSQKISAQKPKISFSDVSKKHRHKKAIEFVQQRGIVSGYSSKKSGDSTAGSANEASVFKPNAPINRAEFTKILVLAKFSHGEISTSEIGREKFPDVDFSEWYAPYAVFAKEKNILSGYADGSFGPANNITFAESAKILVNTLLEAPETQSSDEWFTPYIAKLSKRNITAYPPEKLLTRSEMADLIYQVLGDEE